VVLFNILIGPVFSAGSVTGERERQTLDLLLTTVITPWQLLWGKLLSGLRVSSVLSSFLLWPVFLAMLMVKDYWSNVPSILCYVIIFCLSCLTTAIVALFCSTVFNKTSTSLIATYFIILALYLSPVACSFFGNEYFPGAPGTAIVNTATISSPFAAAFKVPLYVESDISDESAKSNWNTNDRWSRKGNIFGYRLSDLRHFAGYCCFTITLNLLLFLTMLRMFNSRWRVSSASS
jgi:ABC-type transport system involved in multi-copper enzyme maturation permease subunit